jgi:hypothetical protein
MHTLAPEFRRMGVHAVYGQPRKRRQIKVRRNSNRERTQASHDRGKHEAGYRVYGDGC